jgi:hypothetical protein
VVDKAIFFKHMTDFHGGHLSQSQVTGYNAIIDGWDLSSKKDLVHALSVAYFNSGGSMEPVRELGGKDYYINKYWHNKRIRQQLGNRGVQDAYNFYSRGYFPVTGYDEYANYSGITGIDFTVNPDVVLVPQVSASILYLQLKNKEINLKDYSKYFSIFNETITFTDDPTFNEQLQKLIKDGRR